MTAKLGVYEDFQEGGTRITIELGRPTTLAEITLNVIMYNQDDDLRQYYFNADITLKEARQIICQEFAGFDGTKEVNPDKHTLYRGDAFNEPQYALRRLNGTFKNNNVTSGELLILQSNRDCDPTSRLKLSIHLTSSGLSADSKFLEDIELFKEMSLNDMKEQLMDLAALHPHTKHLEGPEWLRVREKNHNGFFGRIFRDAKNSLKKNSIKDHSTIVVQILEAPENLEKDDYVIWFSKRDVKTHTYKDKREIIFQGKRLK